MEPQYAKKDSFLLASGKLSTSEVLCPLGRQLDYLLKQQPNFYGFKLLKTNKLRLSIFKVS